VAALVSARPEELSLVPAMAIAQSFSHIPLGEAALDGSIGEGASRLFLPQLNLEVSLPQRVPRRGECLLRFASKRRRSSVRHLKSLPFVTKVW